MINIQNKVDCCGCNACGDACPKGSISFVKDIPFTYLFKNFNKASEQLHRFIFKNFIFNRDDKIHKDSHVFYEIGDEKSVWEYCIDECIFSHTSNYMLEK